MVDHAFLGKITDAAHRLVRYWKMRQEIKRFKSCRNVHELPAIFHYWSNKYLVPKFLPFGFANPTEFFHLYMMRCCRRFRGENCRFISIGAGNCDLETELAQMLLKSGDSNFVLECLDVNEHMLKRGRALAEENGLLSQMRFVCSDISVWEPVEQYHLVMVNHSLHHFVAFANVIDVFVDRNFGHNFDPNCEFDKAFIDKVHAIHEQSIESGSIKPTHMMAAMTRNAVAQTKMNNHLSPQFCVRWPDGG